MGELLSGNFDANKVQQVKSPFQISEVKKNTFEKESRFSPNGMVQYVLGLRPRREGNIKEKVIVHKELMEEAIFFAFPEYRHLKTSEEAKNLTGQLSDLRLVDEIVESDSEDWGIRPEYYLALLEELKKRGFKTKQLQE